MAAKVPLRNLSTAAQSPGSTFKLQLVQLVDDLVRAGPMPLREVASRLIGEDFGRIAVVKMTLIDGRTFSATVTNSEQSSELFQTLAAYVLLVQPFNSPTDFLISADPSKPLGSIGDFQLRAWIEGMFANGIPYFLTYEYLPPTTSDQFVATIHEVARNKAFFEEANFARLGRRLGPSNQELPKRPDVDSVLKMLAQWGVSAELCKIVSEQISASKDVADLFPTLTKAQEKQIADHAKKRPWANRRKFGYVWNTDVFEFVRAEYGKWIPGLTQAHLTVDPDLYRKFLNAVTLRGLPNSLDVPAEHDAAIRRIADPWERAKLLIQREATKERTAQFRASIKKPKNRPRGRPRNP